MRRQAVAMLGWVQRADEIACAGPANLDVPATGAEAQAAKSDVSPGLTPPTQAAAELARQSAGEEGPAAPSNDSSPQESAEAADKAGDADDGELKAADLRALTVKDFQEAMKQVRGSLMSPWSMHSKKLQYSSTSFARTLQSRSAKMPDVAFHAEPSCWDWE